MADRIEDSSSDLGRFLKSDPRQQMIRTLKSFGYTYVALDLEGYRSGPMNEAFDWDRAYLVRAEAEETMKYL